MDYNHLDLSPRELRLKKAGIFGLLALFFIGSFGLVDAAWLDDVLTTTPDNSWREVPLKMSDGCGKFKMTAWGGGALNPVTGRLAGHGGGHSDGWENTVCVADLVNGQIYIGAQPSPASAACFDCPSYVDGKPTSDHSYDHVVYNPVVGGPNGTFYRLGTASANGSGQYQNFIVWKNPLYPNDQWTNEGVYATGRYNAIGSSSGVDGDGVMYVATTSNIGTPTIFKIDPFAKAYTALTEIQGGNRYTGTAVATGKSGAGKNYFAIVDDGSTKVINLNNIAGGWRTISAGGGSGAPGVARVNEKEILTFGGGTTLNLINLDTGSSQPYQTSVMAGSTLYSPDVTGIYGAFDCFPYGSKFVCAFASSSTNNINILKATAMASKSTNQFVSQPGCSPDNDGDGFCPPTDCNDGDANVRPGATDVCGNGLDEDCGGGDAVCVCTPNASRACYTGPTGAQGVGACRAGTETCRGDGSGWNDCQGEVLPQAEQCGNEVDDDCDGQIDEGCGVVGVCKLDVNGDGNINVLDVVALIRPLLKVEPYSAAKDVNDDGAINILDVVKVATSINQPLNEVCPDTTTCTPNQSSSCPTGQPGACATGSQVCNASGTGYGACTPNQSPATETCNNVDDDCDGSIDEGNVCAACTPGAKQSCYTGSTGTQGIGACKAGERTCLSTGQWGECIGQVTPATDTCGDGLDQDCDGADAVCGLLPTNKIIIYNREGTVQTDIPVTIARPFRRGDIPDFAKASINGDSVLTQTDVKNRWPDGSLKFALVSFIVPSIPAGGSVEVFFSSQATGNNDNYLTPQQMLGSAYDFDATMQLSGAQSASVSAREMLQNDKFITYWQQGPIVTTVIIEDVDRGRDMGVDGSSSMPNLHPIFGVSFFPSTKDVKISYTIENAWASSDPKKSMRNASYSLVLKSGYTNPVTELSHSGVSHPGKTVVHVRNKWLGSTDPKKVNIDGYLPYLATTGIIRPYDPSLAPSPESLQTFANGFDSSPKDYLAGTGMGMYDSVLTAGGDGVHIGPNRFVAFYLQAMGTTLGDKLLEIALFHADASGKLSYWFREADTLAGAGDWFLPGTQVDTYGRVPSGFARRTTMLRDVNDPTYTDQVDRYSLSFTDGIKVATSHMPYAGEYYWLTGDPYDYRLALNSGAYAAMYANDNYFPGDPASGGYLSVCAHEYSGRGQSHCIANVANSYLAAVDGSPEKELFGEYISRFIAAKEGISMLPESDPAHHDSYLLGRDVVATGFQVRNGFSTPSPLGFPRRSSYDARGDNTYTGSVRMGDAMWMISFEANALDDIRRATEFDVSNLQKQLAKVYFNILLNPAVSPYRVGAYTVPVTKLVDGQEEWIDNWGEWENMHAADATSCFVSGGPHSYYGLAYRAVSTLYDYTVDGYTGAQAYEKMKALCPGAQDGGWEYYFTNKLGTPNAVAPFSVTTRQN